ncbi:MAG: hypothetical protein CFE38_13950 [Comamonadaceae bacterium PBBC1]|nr:MAG: hypothetical protein CFE38_13950 [Comamonadaceae bacterium PBBC1]
MLLNQTDIDFILAQLNLPGNDPRRALTGLGTVLDPSGIRDVGGVGNNVNNPGWGAVDQAFTRLTTAGWTNAQGTLNQSFQPNNTPTSYQVRDVNLWDSTPRIISNIVANQSSAALAAIGYTTQEQQRLAVLDDPMTTPGGRVSPLTGNMNPLPYSGFMTMFGQFFDHGLDFVHKGSDGVVMVPLMPGDPLYDPASQTNFMMASRTNTIHVQIGEETTNTLLGLLGISETTGTPGSQTAVTGTAVLGNSFSGVLMINNTAIELAANTTQQGLLDAINAKSSTTGIVASLSGSGNLVLTPPAGKESINTISPFIDLSQSYGSDPSKTAFVREYDTARNVTGRLVSGNGDVGAEGMSTWLAIKVNAARLGIILHDVNVTDTPMVRLNADGSVFIGATGTLQAGGWLVARDVVSGNVFYVKDSYMAANTGNNILNADGTVASVSVANLRLQTVGHAFLDDMAHGVLDGAKTDAGDLVNPTLLNAHIIAGDGRANENLGLTAIHEVFHSEHNNVLNDIKALVFGGTDSSGVTHVARADAGTWTGEMLFQAAKMVTEMEYQHLVFGEFARKLSPNVNAFAAYDVTIDPAITAEFAHAVYRFGHSMLTESVDMLGFDATTGLVNGVDNSMGLIEAFLNPTAYTSTTAGEIALGMGSQVANGIDEWVTGALRNNLVGLPLDLATLNMVRGRDTGMASLNAVRADLFAQTGDVQLKPYDNWLEFGMNLVHHESLVNFVMAYARDTIIIEFNGAAGVNVGTKAQWDALQLADAATYNTKLRLAAEAALNDVGGVGDPAFLLRNDGLNNVDFWLGGLAEAKVAGGMLGSTFDFIFAMQMISLQNSDRFYYLGRLAGTDLLLNIEAQLFSDIVSRNTGVNHLYSDIFTVADSYVEIADTTGTLPLWTLGNALGKAGFIGDTFYGNTGNYLDSRGVLNPNGKGNASEMIGGTDAANKINAGGGNDTVWGDGGNDTIEGATGNDFLHGGLGDDRITDSEGDDLIWGDEGNDTIVAGAGIDQVFGDEGDDVMYGGLGADVMDGGTGNDIIYGDNGAITTRVFNGSTIQVMDSNGDADIINGGDGDDTIYGGGGVDAIDGGEGNDMIYGGVGADNLIGWTGDDTFMMDADDFGFANILDGGDGFDTVNYSASMGNGVGTGANRQGININLSNLGPAVVPGVALAPQIADAYLSVEGVVGTAYNDTLTGGASVAAGTGLLLDALGLPINFGTVLAPVFLPMDFVLDGGAGNDLINGGDGNDMLMGGTGNDTMVGGLGDDTYFVNAAGDVVTELALGGIDEIITTRNSQSLANLAQIENLSFDSTNGTGDFTGTGNAANNMISGGQGNDTLNGGAGIDTLVGGNGNDTYQVDTTTDVIIEGVNGGSDTISTTVNMNYTLVGTTGIENLTLGGTGTGTGNDAGNVLTSGAAINTLVGNGGNDTLIGGGGNDTLNGGLGRDVYAYIGAATTANLGTDLIQDFVRGEDLIDLSALTGFTGGFTFIGTNAFTADAVNQVRIQITGATTAIQIDTNNNNAAELTINLTGALALDATDFVGVTAAGGNVPTGVPATPTAGNDLIQLNPGNNTLNALAGNDIVMGHTGNDTISGGAGNDNLMGGAGNDTLNGDAGNDNLMGDAGNDILNGGAGLDILTGGAGADLFTFNTTLNRTTNVDTIADFTTADGDKIQLENAIFTRLLTTGTLNAANFRAGTAAADNNDYIVYDQATGRLYYDADGNGATASVLFATISNPGVLTNNDFVVI